MSSIRQTHYLAKPIVHAPGSKIYWSREPGGSAMIFVHGFIGHPTKTWNDFPKFLLSDPRCAGNDIIFFKYRSTQFTFYGARDLYNLMGRLFQEPQSLISGEN